jgi:hypothetical protein
VTCAAALLRAAAWRHYGYGFDEETLRYARDLVRAIRELLAWERTL